MKEGLKKRWRGHPVLLSLAVFFIALVLTVYFLLTSPRFIFWAIQQLNRIIPGQIVYEQLQLDFKGRTVDIKDLKYLNESEQLVLWVDESHLTFKLGGIFKGHLEIPQLQVNNLVFDAKNLPKREQEGPIKSQWRSVLKILLKRISVGDGQVALLDIRTKNDLQAKLKKVQFALSPPKITTQKIKMIAAESEIHSKDKLIKTGLLSYDGQIDLPAVQTHAFFVAGAKGPLKLEKVVYCDRPLGTLYAELEIDGDKLSLKKSTFEGPFAALGFDLSYSHHADNPQWDINLKTQKEIQLESFPIHLSKNFTSTFRALKLEVKAQLKGKSLATAQGNLALKAQAFAKAAPFDPAEDYDLQAEGPISQGVLDLKKFEVKAPKTLLQASGKIDFAKQLFDVRAEAKIFSLTDLMNSITEIDLRGRVQLKGTIRGPFKKPDFSFDVESQEAAYSIMNFGKIVGHFKIENGDLTFVGGTTTDGRKANVDVSVKNVFVKTRETKLTANYENLDVSAMLANPDMKGKISGTFEMTSHNSQLQGLVKGRIQDFFLYNFNLGPVNVEGELNNSSFTLTSLDFQPPNFSVVKVPKPVVFKFDDKGWTVEGEVLPGAAMKGVFLKSNPTKVHVDATAQNVDLRPIWVALSMPNIESYADGKITMDLGFRNNPTVIRIEASRLLIPADEFSIQNRSPIILTIRPPKMELQRVEIETLGEVFSIQGSYIFSGDMNLQIQGDANLGLLKFFPEYFRDGSGFAKLDLNVRGKLEDPKISGDIQFNDAGLTFRPVRMEIEDINGRMRFSGDSIVLDHLSGIAREGDLVVTGKIDLKNYVPQFYDLLVQAREVAIAEPEVYKVIFSGDFSFKGPAEKVVLSGIMDITEGTYSRDFSVSEFFIKPQVASLPEPPSQFLQNIDLNLTVRSPGELAIKNNIARMFFRSDLQVKGPATQPQIAGALEIIDGTFNYFKINFDKARGVIDFRDYKRGAYVDVTATKEFSDSFDSPIVVVHIFGFLDNLRIDFESNPPLAKRDIISLLFTGSLPGNARRLSGVNIATTILASQLSEVIQRSLARSGQLDIFRIEASDQERGTFSTLIVGKRLTDRFSLEFKTDLGATESVQGVQMEYLLLDNVLAKASQLSDGRFNLDLTLRFQLY